MKVTTAVRGPFESAVSCAGTSVKVTLLPEVPLPVAVNQGTEELAVQVSAAPVSLVVKRSCVNDAAAVDAPLIVKDAAFGVNVSVDAERCRSPE